MESEFQNYISGFDLNLFEQTANVNRSIASAQCPISRKLGIARIKDRLKGVSQVVHKAKNTDEMMLEVQKELLNTKQELEETRNLLFEKNEEHKVICDERSTYFNQTSELRKDIENLKKQLKKFEEIDFSAQLKDKVISGYSEQMKALQTEMDILLESKKESSRNASNTLQRVKSSKNLLEKQLIRVLKDYVIPNTKRRSSWLTSIVKRYLPGEIKEEKEDEKAQKPNEVDENEDEISSDAEVPLPHQVLQRNISTDFDNVESVDTGRGSSLAFSDGDKSYHSPDYYMEDSSPGINPCTKCNVHKSDASTSPVSQDTPVVLIDSATNILKECVLELRKDACTSPILSLTQNTATDTADFLLQTSPKNRDITPLENNDSVERETTNSTAAVLDVKDFSTEPAMIPEKEIFTRPLKLQNITFDSGDEDDEIINDVNRITSPVGELNALSSTDFDEVVTICNNNISNEKVPSVNEKQITPRIQNNEGLTSRDSEEIVFTVKLQIDATSDIEDDEARNRTNGITSSFEESSMLSPVNYDNFTSLSPTLPSNEPILREIWNNTSDSNLSVSRNIEQGNTCFELHNSNSSSNDVEIDSEVRTILDKMRLRCSVISPLPDTPQSVMESPIPPVTCVNHNNRVQEPELNAVAESVNSQLNLLRSSVQEVFTPFVKTLPNCFEQVLRLLNDKNKIILNNFMLDPNNTTKEKECNFSSAKKHIKSGNNRRTEVVDLNSCSTLNIAAVNENEVDSPGEYVIMEDNLQTNNLEQIASTDSRSVQHDSVCDLNEVSHVLKESAATLNTETSHLKPSDDENVDSSDSNYANERHENTHMLLDSDSECTEDTQPLSMWINVDASPSSIPLKSNIVYEVDETCDDNIGLDGTIQDINENSYEFIRKIRGRGRKLTKLERLRQKMVPKGKIRQGLKKSVRKPRFKPIPITPPIPKKKVTSSDTAATLNDKTVYENAVKVLAAQKLIYTEPKVIIKDCVRYPQNNYLNNEKKDDQNNNLNVQCIDTKTNKKRKSSESGKNAAEKQSFKENHIFDLKETKKGKQASLCIEGSLEHVLLENHTNTSPNKIKQNANNITSPRCTVRAKSDSIISSAKRTRQSAHTPDSSDVKEAKRKRISVSDHQSPNKNLNSNSNTVESDSSRILRSSTHVKHIDETGLDGNRKTVVGKSREGLRSRADPTQYGNEKHEISQILSPVVGRKHTISRVITPTQKDSEYLRVVSDNSTSPKSTQKYNNRSAAFSVVDDLMSHGNDAKNTPIISAKKQRISRVNTHEHSAYMSQKNKDRPSIVSYADLDSLSNNDNISQAVEEATACSGDKDSLLCRMIDTHGKRRLFFKARQAPESRVQEVCDKLETSLSEIVELPHDMCVSGMKKLVADIRTWDVKHFLLGFIKFLKNPERKNELFNKTTCPPAPPMTKKEQVLLYVFDELQKSYAYKNIIKKLLANIEYALFALNKPTEEFNVIEVMSHFYAVLCRSYQKISRLRLFIIDAMYCLQFKCMVLIQQCLDVWHFVLPLGHMGLAKCPLVTCLVYLLHFYKCEDKYNRLQDIRNTLRWKYNYNLNEWNEPKILELFRAAVTDIKDNPVEKKILRLSLIILAKRNGAAWCHNNIVKNMLQPIINDSKTSEAAKQFSVSILGPLLKPYPGNMKVHTETIIDYLMDMLNKKNSLKMQEAIISSLICVEKDNNRLYRYLVNWKPKCVSPEFECLFRNYVRSKTVDSWKYILSWQI